MHRTNPRHWLDVVLWPILVVTWERFSKKHAHWWHWRDYTGPVMNTLTAPANPHAGDRSKGLLANLWYTNFGWSEILVLKPMSHTGTYQIGFRSNEGNGMRTQLCALVLTGETAVQLSPVETEFFAVDYQGRPIQIMAVIQTSKKLLGKATLI